MAHRIFFWSFLPGLCVENPLLKMMPAWLSHTYVMNFDLNTEQNKIIYYLQSTFKASENLRLVDTYAAKHNVMKSLPLLAHSSYWGKRAWGVSFHFFTSISIY